jgi:8-oxo-dGTP pyrophosphatase MutT (NUDIX family)
MASFSTFPGSRAGVAAKDMIAKINKTVTLSQGRVFDFRRENVTLENGVTVDLDIVRHPGASAIVPLFPDDTVILIKQYRHAIGNFIWEIPAGTLDPDETPIECAKRELIEESGFSANTWQRLGEIIPVPGYSDERIHIFLATDLLPSNQDLDEDEMLDIHKVKRVEAVRMIHKGLIQDAKTISGLFLAAHWLEKNGGLKA